MDFIREGLEDFAGEDLEDFAGEDLEDFAGEDLEDLAGEDLEDLAGEDLEDLAGEGLEGLEDLAGEGLARQEVNLAGVDLDLDLAVEDFTGGAIHMAEPDTSIGTDAAKVVSVDGFLPLLRLSFCL